MSFKPLSIQWNTEHGFHIKLHVVAIVEIGGFPETHMFEFCGEDQFWYLSIFWSEFGKQAKHISYAANQLLSGSESTNQKISENQRIIFANIRDQERFFFHILQYKVKEFYLNMRQIGSISCWFKN